MLKEYRTEKTPFTQEKMAQLLEISLSTYTRIERTNNCQLKIARSISVIFGDSIENIFFKKNEN